MGYLDQILAGIDNMRRVAGRNASDLVNDPMGYAQRTVDVLRNTNAGLSPEINNQEATLRPLSLEERVANANQGALDTVSGGLGVIKPRGGNFFVPTPTRMAGRPYATVPEREQLAQEHITKYLEAAPEVREQFLPVARGSLWELASARMDSAMEKWRATHAGTAEDPVLALAEKGIYPYKDIDALKAAAKGASDADKLYYGTMNLTKKRTSQGYPGRGIARTPEGREWEKISDSMIDPTYTVKSMREGSGSALGRRTFEESWPSNDVAQEFVEKNPWSANVDPETKVYRKAVTPEFSEMSQALSKSLVSGTLPGQAAEIPSHLRLTPFDLQRMDFPQMVQHAHKSIEWQKAQKAKAEALRGNLRSQREPVMAFDNGFKWTELNQPGEFAAESDAMGHSVRGYEPTKTSPDFDPVLSGEGGHGTYGHGGWGAIQSGKAQVLSLSDPKGRPAVTVEILNHPDGTSEVSQIKGRTNAKPKPEYMPMVREFLQSRKWRKIGDARNSGLTPEEISELLRNE